MDYQVRLKSLVKWPSKGSWDVEKAAEIGLFNPFKDEEEDEGNHDDRIECFRCGVEIIGPFEECDPYQLHLMYNRHCSVLKEFKGQEYYCSTQQLLLGTYMKLPLITAFTNF